MSKPVILLDAGQLVGLSGSADGDVLTWDAATSSWKAEPEGSVGTVTSVALDAGTTGLTVSGSSSQTITSSGTFTLGGTLSAGSGGTGLGAPAVGDAGKVLAATAGGTYELVANGNGTVTSITAGTGLSGGTITTSGTISMPNVGTAGAYGSASSVPVITTDAQGRVTGVVPTSIAIAQSAVTDLVSDLAGKVATSTQVIAGTGLSGGGALSSNVTLSLPSVGTQGTYGSASSVAVVTTDQQGRVSNAVTTSIAITQSQVADLVTDLGLKADKAITISAGTGLTGGGDLSANRTLSLDTVGTAQTGLGSASKTVTISTDAYGRVTSLSEQSIGSLPASVITSGQIELAHGGTGINASGVTAGQLLVGGTGALALQSVSGDASLASTGALTVTGLQSNPVSSGSLGAGDAGKALIWSGSAWQAAVIPGGGGGGGGGGLTLYCNYAASSPYILDTAFDEHAQWNTGAITVANDAAGTELARFYTPTSFVVEVIPAGIWDLNVFAQASGVANDTAIRAKVGVWNGSTLTVLGTSDYAYITDPTVLTQYKASVYVPTYDVTTGDRIAVVIEGRRFAATTQTVTGYFGTGAISHVHSTLNAPGGTGLLKVVDGYLQSPASLLVNADVDAAAAIAVSKLAAGTDTYVLTTVSGVPTWAAPSGGGVTSVTGTENQVLVNAGFGTPETGALTLTLPQDISTASSPTFTGLSLTGPSFGLIRLDLYNQLVGAAQVSLTSEVTGTLPVSNGGTGIASAGASGNLLVSDGSTFASVSMSNDATIASTGALTLKNTGTAGTYGSASAVPVFVTDAQGRVTSVTNTNIAIGASAITSGTLGVTRGGTGLSSISTGQILYASGFNTLATGTLSSLDWSNILPTGAATVSIGSFGAMYLGYVGTTQLFIGSAITTTAVAGTLTAATAAVDTNTTQVATTAYVVGQGYLKSATAASTYAPLASPTFTGTVTLPLTTAGYVTTTSGGVISSSATIPTSDLSGSIALGSQVSGTLPVGNGGTGATTLTGYVKGNGASAMTASATIPTSDLSGSISLTTQVTGTLPVGNGGTGLSSIASGQILYASGTNTLAAGTLSSLNWSAVNPVSNVDIAPFFVTSGGGRTTNVSGGYTNNGTGGAITLRGGNVLVGTGGATNLTGGSGTVANGAVNIGATTTSAVNIGATGITTTISGTLALANDLALSEGGTGASLSASAGAVAYSTASALALTAVGTSGQFLKSNGASAPGFASIAVADVSGAAPLASPTFTGTVTLPLTTAGYVTTTSGGVISSSATVPTSDLSGSIALGSQVSGTLPVGNGGTGATTLTGYVKGNGASAMTASATVPTSDLSGTVSLTTQVSGTLPVANGGTGAATTQANKVFAGPTTGADAAPSFRALVAADVAGLTPYDLAGEFVGTPVASATIMRFVAARAFTLSGTAYFACTSNTGATAAVFTVSVAGVSKGTVSIAGNATSGTGTITSTSVTAGQTVDVVATTPANIVNVWFTLPGTV